ncbi:copper resistance CopC family protein [Actinomadura rudentiformis]|uniref:Copper resistance protein CopC n=1 Tax=Actinomadura rudentiformis TaxID=359158 RepID=A0A6H9YV38_9ACTN|nr:copper resistance CopC family protein [Actinomadura rudentiformis]KAB2350939.1 copper resistance protein CopC [Actinomadura rudentiformis]
MTFLIRTALIRTALIRTALIRTAAATGAVSAVLALTAAPASAHTALRDSDPKAKSTVESPTQITLTYNQPVTIPRVILTDDKGEQHTSGTPKAVDNKVTQPVAGTLPNGDYTVGWRVVSADGHPVSGSFTFTVKGSSSPAGIIRSKDAAPVPTLTVKMTTAPAAAEDSGGSSGWLWIGLIALAVAAAAGAGSLLKRRRTG